MKVFPSIWKVLTWMSFWRLGKQTDFPLFLLPTLYKTNLLSDLHARIASQNHRVTQLSSAESTHLSTTPLHMLVLLQMFWLCLHSTYNFKRLHIHAIHQTTWFTLCLNTGHASLCCPGESKPKHKPVFWCLSKFLHFILEKKKFARLRQHWISFSETVFFLLIQVLEKSLSHWQHTLSLRGYDNVINLLLFFF